MIGAARTRPPPFRRCIPHAERAAAKVFGEGLRRCVAQKKFFGKKVNPLKAIRRESDFISRHRFPKSLVRWLAKEFGKSPFWDKKTEYDVDGLDNFCNAEYVVSKFSFTTKDTLFPNFFWRKLITSIQKLYFQTCMGLRYLATGAPQTVLQDIQGRCVKGTVSKNVNKFIEFCALMSARNVKFPEVNIFVRLVKVIPLS